MGRIIDSIAWFAILPVIAILAAAQQRPAEPATADLLDALAGTAAVFSHSAPGLLAREDLHQRGRRGLISLPPRDSRDEPENASVKLPQSFHIHDVISDYSFAQMGKEGVIHEIRAVLAIDGRAVSRERDARRALILGFQSPGDDLRLRLLEKFEHSRLEGAVTDFGQTILLFAGAAQRNYRFTRGSDRLFGKEPVAVVAYDQIAGDSGLTVFHERTGSVRSARGEIWLRRSDLLPLRITMFTDATLPGELTVRDQAVIDYTPTPFGLAPLHIRHMQFLNSDLVVENDLRYSGYQRLTPGILP